MSHPGFTALLPNFILKILKIAGTGFLLDEGLHWNEEAHEHLTVPMGCLKSLKPIKNQDPAPILMAAPVREKRVQFSASPLSRKLFRYICTSFRFLVFPGFTIRRHNHGRKIFPA